MAQQIIPVVAFGVYRHVAATTVDLFLNTPYTMAAIVDLNIEPSAFRYTPHNLGVVLHTLIPRPQVFITGAMITEEMTYESIAVWEKYVIDCKVEKTLVINLLVEPLDGGWKAAIMKKLDETFKKDKK